jgi:hypothetical protein
MSGIGSRKTIYFKTKLFIIMDYRITYFQLQFDRHYYSSRIEQQISTMGCVDEEKAIHKQLVEKGFFRSESDGDKFAADLHELILDKLKKRRDNSNLNQKLWDFIKDTDVKDYRADSYPEVCNGKLDRWLNLNGEYVREIELVTKKSNDIEIKINLANLGVDFDYASINYVGGSGQWISWNLTLTLKGEEIEEPTHMVVLRYLEGGDYSKRKIQKVYFSKSNISNLKYKDGKIVSASFFDSGFMDKYRSVKFSTFMSYKREHDHWKMNSWNHKDSDFVNLQNNKRKIADLFGRNVGELEPISFYKSDYDKLTTKASMPSDSEDKIKVSFENGSYIIFSQTKLKRSNISIDDAWIGAYDSTAVKDSLSDIKDKFLCTK